MCPWAFVTPPRVRELAPFDFNTGDAPVVVVTRIDAGGRADGVSRIIRRDFPGAHPPTGPGYLLQ